MPWPWHPKNATSAHAPLAEYHVCMSNDTSPDRRRPLRRFVRNWLERHQHPVSFAIHLIGIPLAFAGVVMFFTSPWPWALAAFVMGYLLQWIGHQIEGNDMGEWAGIKRMLGLPYVAIAPRYAGQQRETESPNE